MKNHFLQRVCTVCCLLILFVSTSYAYTERNLLQNSVTKEQLKEALVMNGAWVPYPAYSDREGWNSLLNEEDRQTLINAGEKMIDYKWQVIRATDYLEYERSGERNIMQNPYEANRKAINVLMMAELAERGSIHTDAMTVTGKTVAENIRNARVLDPEVIRPLDRPFGKSRISRSVMSITDSAVRTALRSEVAAEFFTSPQRYLLGADEDTFKDDPDGKKLKMWMGAVQVFTTNREGDTPQYGQLQAMSMQPHVDYMRSLAARLSGETGIPVSMLGVIHDNPSSAEAMYAASEELIIEAEALNRTNGRSLRNVARLVTAVRQGKTLAELTEDELAVRPNFKNPMRPSIASTADAMVKIAGVLPDFAGTDVFWEQLGFSEDVRDRVRTQLRTSQARSAAMATAQAALAQGRQVTDGGIAGQAEQVSV